MYNIGILSSFRHVKAPRRRGQRALSGFPEQSGHITRRMIINYLLRPFKKRLIKEDFLRSLIGALSAASVVAFVLSFIYHFRIQEPDMKLLLLCFAGTFTAVFLFLFFIVFYPWRKKVARRIDDSGLKDRISTMLEFRKDDSPVAYVQRRNAQWYLRTMNPKRIRLNINRKHVIIATACFLLMVGMLLTPYDIFARINPELEARIALEKKIEAIAERLRTEITDASFPESIEEPLLATVETLRENMLAGSNDLQRATSLIKARQEMEETVGLFVSRLEIGDAFQKYSTTRSMGVSLTVGDGEMTESSLYEASDQLIGNRDTASVLASEISSALSESGVDPADGLLSAFTVFSAFLTEDHSELQDEQYRGELDALTSQILDEFGIQTDVEAKFQALGETFQEIQDDLLGYTRPEDPAAGVVNNDGDVIEVEEGVDLRDRDAGIGRTGTRDIFKGMDEPMYDPELGVVTFGEVYERYYQKYKEQLKAGVIPEELQSMLDRYFYWLNN